MEFYYNPIWENEDKTFNPIPVREAFDGMGVGEEGCEALLVYFSVLSTVISTRLNLRGISGLFSALKQRKRQEEGILLILLVS